MSCLPFTQLCCPLDGDLLQLQGTRWRCPSSHSFDVAREGYIHLLPVQNKRSLDPGDNKPMVAARRSFLNAGYYQPIAEAVNRCCLQDLTSEHSYACLDAGSGEGYYLRQLSLAAKEQNKTIALLGLDISKWATQAAAKQDKDGHCTWVVGSNANIPAPPQSLDRLLCLFGFPVYSEFARVLRPQGRLIQVDATSEHLKELREVIYPVLKEKPQTEPKIPEGFALIATEYVEYALSLTQPETIAQLLAMTPHLYRASAEGRARAAALTHLSTQVSVRICCFERL